VKTIGARIEALEETAGHCPACASAPPVVRVRGIPRLPHDSPEPPEGAGVCPRCGHDRTVIIEIELVKRDEPAHLEAKR
jgi:hypothetical protein